MNIHELLEKLRKSGITLSPSTVRRWAKGGEFVTPPTLRHRRKGEGRGKISDWSQQSLEEIAGLWAVRENVRHDVSCVYFREFDDSVRTAKKLADVFYADPIGWELYKKQVLYNKFYVRNEFDDIDKLIGKSLHEADFRNFTEWVTAVEKIRRGYQISQPVCCDFVFLYDGNLRDRTFRYRFLGVRLGQLEESMQSQVRVIVHKRDVFAKAVRDTYGGTLEVDTK